MRPGLFYNVALALVGLGYVVLLVVLLGAKPESPRIGRVSADEAAELSTTPSVNAAFQRGFRPNGTPAAKCYPEPPSSWTCAVSGYKNAAGQECTVTMRVDASQRRPIAAASGSTCSGTTPLPR